MAARVRHLNPAGMHTNPAFSQAVVVEESARTIYVGGQNAVSADGRAVGAGDLARQTEQVFENLQTVLASAGAELHDIVKWTIHVVQGQDVRPAFGVVRRVWGAAPPPAISVIVVAGLANPEYLVELEAIAVTGASGGED
ncbi:MAG TPA: RidA family protein [Chloroflexota bacterium]|nr:RidA family protein [Chloroflexota bacterium]